MFRYYRSISFSKMAEAMRAAVSRMLKGIDRYNPDNLATLERYVEAQARENTYDLEANLAVLKLYQFNTNCYQSSVVVLILLKALTNLPHTDFILCKCLLDQNKEQTKDQNKDQTKDQTSSQNPDKPALDDPVTKVMLLADLLEMCHFKHFWHEIRKCNDIIAGITGFEDSIRKFVCHVINITYQTIEKSVLCELLGGITGGHLTHWISKYGWKEIPGGLVFISNKEENIKTKNITEKIDFDSLAAIMSMSL